ncbi:hypothetical protein HY229_06630 [Candidatus Acetothermia bacterium]|nr:hypothetical protein [Candidatus Acetothermia bacterium]MBI3643758.1 hypothetical protein [Candidatus Acetothermia bacterium]
MRCKVLLFALLFAAISGSSAWAGTWMIKQEVLQPFSQDQCSFDTVLLGTTSTQGLSGGDMDVSNSFPTPRWKLADTGESVHVAWTGDRVISPSSSQRYSFGISGKGQMMPRVQDIYWSECPSERTQLGIVPGVSIDSISSPYTGTAMVTISNTTNEAILVDDISYMSRPFAELRDLDSSIIPPGKFSSVNIPSNMQLLPGKFFTFPVNNARRTDFLIMKFDVRYDVAPARINPYKGTTQEWFAFREIDENPTTIYSFDADQNLFIDDHEFFKAVDFWINQTIDDYLFFQVVDAWVASASLPRQNTVGHSANPGEVTLSATPSGMTFAAMDRESRSVGVEIYRLSGEHAFSGSAEGSHLTWGLRGANGSAVANGIYLYVITTQDRNGNVVRSEVKKLVVMH